MCSPYFCLMATEKKQYMACRVLTTWQSSRKQDSHEKNKQIKVRVKSIQRVDVLLCAPRVSPIWWTSTANGDRNARALETGRSQDHRPDFVRHARMARYSACASFTLSDARAQTRTRTTEKTRANPWESDCRPRRRSFKLNRCRKVKS